jgi:hypothetical protein
MAAPGTDVSQLNTDHTIANSCHLYVAEALRRAGLDSLTGLAKELAKGESTGHSGRPTSQEQLQLLRLGARGMEVTPLDAYRKIAIKRRKASISQ